MFKIRNTLELAKLSWGVLKQDRELLALPVLSFLASLALLIPVGVAILVTQNIGSSGSGESTVNPLLAVLGLLTLLGLSVIGVFFNGALVAGAHERLSGGDPTVGSALNRAFHRIGGLVPWALLTATVGIILRLMSERAGWLGQFVVRAIGLAWEVTTFLVVPAIVIDNQRAWEGVKTSGSLLKRTWGENLIARVGFGILGFIAVLPAIALVVLLAFLGTAAVIFGVLLAVIWLAVVVVVLTAMNAIFQTALYMYATTGAAPSGFDNSTIASSFGHR